MEISRRGFFTAGAAAAVAAAPALVNAEGEALKPGQLNEELLGNLLRAMGLKPDKVEQRFDFTFRSVHNKEDWDLSMTSVLSSDKSSIWMMAWLDELPKSATDVPRTALLRLLAANDRLGSGKFFAYVASNRRFVLQRVVPNENISTRRFRDMLQDLGKSVVESYTYWSTANWASKSTTSTADAAKQIPSGASGLQGAGRTPSRTAVRPSSTAKQ
jgi:hypothetical protein